MQMQDQTYKACHAARQRRLLPENGLKTGLPIIHPEFCKRLGRVKILLAPDAFKGSLSAHEVACAMREGLLAANPNLDVMLHPMADGGEGTLDALTPFLDGRTLEMNISGMDGRPVKVPVFQFAFAVIRMQIASDSGCR